MKFSFEIDLKKIKIFLFYTSLFLLICALCIKFNAIDNDLWSRLIMGKHIVQTGHVMFSDIISFTPVHTWYDPEWISSSFFYLIQERFGIIGLTYTKIVAILILISTIILAIKEKNKLYSYNIGYFIFLLLIMLECSIIHFLRCQIFTFILMSLWIYLLEKIRKGQDKYLYFLPFIMLFWLNCHGGCIAGIGILFLYALGEFLNKKPYKKYLIALLFSCLVFFINPWGFDYIKFLIKSSYLDRSWISEWQSPLSNIFGFRTYFILMLSMISCYIYKIIDKKIPYSKINKTKIIILAVIMLLSLKYIKHLGLFIVIYSIFLYDDLFLIFNLLINKLKTYLEINNLASNYIVSIKEIIIYLIIYSFSIVVLLTVPIQTSVNKFAKEQYPIYEMEFLKQNNITGNIFAPFGVSAFIAYKYFPEFKIYMDGREEQVYNSNIFDDEMFFLVGIDKMYYQRIKKRNVDIFLIDANSPSQKYLNEDKEYKKIFIDKNYIIYVKNNLSKFNYIYPEPIKRVYFDNIFDTKIDFKENK